MVIDAYVKKDLLKWNDNEDVYSQFEKKCEILSRLTKTIIDPSSYKLQYDTHSFAMDYFVNLQTEIYGYIYEKYPELEFGMSGRLKSPFSHYEKVIRKSVELLEKNEFHVVEILDIYAMKVFIRSVSHNISAVSFDSDGIYVKEEENIFRVGNNDVFSIPYNDSTIDAVVQIENRTLKNGKQKQYPNIFVEDATPCIRIERDNQMLVLPLTSAVNYKRSNRDDLIGYCVAIDKDIEKFLTSPKYKKRFQIKKRKDYISTQKPSGYQSLQCSFLSKNGLGLECQTRTADMELFSNLERAEGYKPNERKISDNAMYKVPHFVLTTKFKDGGYTSYPMTQSQCFEYLYKTKSDKYIKRTSRKAKSEAVKPIAENTKEPKQPEEDVR